MEVRPGYKQTEVGVIPADWEVKPLREVARIRSGIAKNANIATTDPVLVHYLRVANVQDGFLDLSEMSTIEVSRSDLQRFAVLPGDVLMNEGGDRDKLGRGSIWRGEFQPCIHQNHVFVVRCGRFVIPDYLTIWSAGSTARRYFLVAGKQTTNLASINKTALGGLPVLVPNADEQRAIAAALSDVDALLGGLDRLIAKKRDLKRAAMQQLLTGQTRLPGFHGEWEETTFGSVVKHHAGNSTLIKGKLPSSEATGLFPAYSASGQDVWCDHFECEGDAIVVSAVGSRCGKAFKAFGKWCAIANTHVVWPNSAKIDARFLAYFINDEDFWQKSGTGQPFVLFTKTFARPLRLPELPEQTAIAEVLTDMDAEISALVARRDKTRALKQAMMQELLTGRTRLV